jgi:hypothetical protein
MAYDIIGDVHGQDGKLTALLAKLGYRVKDGAYRHPEGRIALFLGDLIDRGPGQLEVINIVRNVIEAGSGRTIMGNHEWNAIGFATDRPDGKGFLRARSANRTKQHAAFLEQVGMDSPRHKNLVGWFKTLPPFLDLGAIRLCHAWWNPEFVDLVGRNSCEDGSLSEEFLFSSFERNKDAFLAMKGITSGLEVDLPEGSSFVDHTGIDRKEIRARWWDTGATTYRKAGMVPEAGRDRIPDLELPETVKLGNDSGVPTFLGHYWLTGAPVIQNAKTAVLDYSAALKGPLVAYRWDGEDLLSNENLVWVKG